MTHTGPMSDSAGDLSEWKNEKDVQCHWCKRVGQVSSRLWESHCGGFEDYEYRCAHCGHTWWVDGIDS